MLKHSLITNFASQIITAALSIVMVPIYVRHLGVEAYGLIAINAVLLAWVQVLDLGLSPTLCRELGSLRAGTGSKVEVSLLLESLEKLIIGLCAVLLVLSIFVAPFFADRWLKTTSLPAHDIRIAFVLMMFTASARWLSALYRGGVVGIDRQVALNGIVVTFALIRSVLVVPLIALVPRIEVFSRGNSRPLSAKRRRCAFCLVIRSMRASSQCASRCRCFCRERSYRCQSHSRRLCGRGRRR